MADVSRVLTSATWIAATLLAAAPGRAEMPPPGYFTGLFERVGRDASGRLIEDYVRLEVSGDGFKMLQCPALDAAPPLVELRITEDFGEERNLMTGAWGDSQILCKYFTYLDNYPIYNCRANQNEKFTLWPKGSAPGCDPSE